MGPIEIFNKLKNNIILSFYHGSKVYGTQTKFSDVDIVCIIKDNIIDFNDIPYNIFQYYDDETNTEYQFIEESHWLKMIDNHHIIVLEALSLPLDMIINGDIDQYIKLFNLDKWKLRQTISAIAENAYAKCHKKLTVKEDYDLYRAKKSIFHSIRILDFGKQIAENGKIIDYHSCNDYWNEIFNSNETEWEYYKEKYKPILNSMRTEFVKLCPKPIK